MSSRFPHSFQHGFPNHLKVSCFLCTKSHEETRKLQAKSRANRGRKWFPLLGNFPGQETIGFHHGFLMEGSV
ncbi:MAG: hypothetical protein OJF50_006721 [Nitrospira sp.]|jgi:hypothetical protein|nr:hypothetical protein [Nitrospira sp.]